MGALVLYMVKYENDQKAAMLNNASMRDRAGIHRKAIADFGGKPIAQYGSYGEYDMVYIYEMPDDVTVAANLHLTDSFGLAKYSKIVPLLSAEDFMRSMEAADKVETEYSPATR
ncbi:GYD domain-containing protein [Roseovarius sp.]|uniref:GYD domain-containing protein n=1 Tax=Roseovarius sp. TaxID=1486281 RepID=UPI00356450C0